MVMFGTWRILMLLVLTVVNVLSGEFDRCASCLKRRQHFMPIVKELGSKQCPVHIQVKRCEMTYGFG
jgi:phage-related holin